VRPKPGGYFTPVFDPVSQTWAMAALTHVFGVGLWAVLTMQGLAVVMTAYPELFNAIAIAGGPVLIWFRQHIKWVDRPMGALLIGLDLPVVTG
jgi:hypothetical protein